MTDPILQSICRKARTQSWWNEWIASYRNSVKDGKDKIGNDIYTLDEWLCVILNGRNGLFIHYDELIPNSECREIAENNIRRSFKLKTLTHDEWRRQYISLYDRGLAVRLQNG